MSPKLIVLGVDAALLTILGAIWYELNRLRHMAVFALEHYLRKAAK